jgi:mono/diheme cytochrome c family protein
MPARRERGNSPVRAGFAVVSLVGMLIAGCGSGEKPEEEAGSVARGRELFARHGCPVCHGEEGRGDGRIAESQKPPPRNLRDPSAYKQGYSIEEVARTIEKGVAGGSSMPAYPHLSEEERRMIASFIAHLRERP